jgi:peroxiredoxin family protein
VPGMVRHTCNPSTQELRQGNCHRSNASLDYTRSYFKKSKEILIKKVLKTSLISRYSILFFIHKNTRCKIYKCQAKIHTFDLALEKQRQADLSSSRPAGSI